MGVPLDYPEFLFLGVEAKRHQQATCTKRAPNNPYGMTENHHSQRKIQVSILYIASPPPANLALRRNLWVSSGKLPLPWSVPTLVVV